MDHSREPVALNRNDRLVAAALGLLVWTVGLYQMVPGICGIYHDDAIYVSTAKALADGQGYRLVNLPDAPPQTKYPILFPAILAVVWKLWPTFPENVVAMQALCLFCAATTVGLAYMYLVRFGYASRKIAAAAGLLSATTPLFLYFATLALSEMPFALLVVVVLWALETAVARRTSSRIGDFGLGILLAVPFLCRTSGAPLIPVGILLLYRARGRFLWTAVGSVAASLPWVVWTILGSLAKQQDAVDGYYTDYVGWWSSLGVPFLSRVFSMNLLTIAWAMVGQSLEGLTKALWEARIASGPLLLALGLVSWPGFFVSHLRQGRVLPWCLCAYLFLICCWPWPVARFLIPILPMLVAYMLLGMSALGKRWLPVRGYRLAAATGVAVAALANVTFIGLYHYLSRQTGYPYNVVPEEDPLAYWSSYEGLFDWLRRNTAADALIATEMDPMFYLYAGRRGFRPFVSDPVAMFYGHDGPMVGTVESLAASLKAHRPRYLVLTPMMYFREPFLRLVDELQQRYPGWLKPVYVGRPDSRFAILELQSEGPPTPVRLASGSGGRD